MSLPDLAAINDFLACDTPDRWLETALQHQPVMLIDHANCEKKAASTALNMIYRYVDKYDLLNKMSRLAREEMRHFEQVIAIMKKRGVDYIQLSSSRYASGMREGLRKHEPEKLIDSLIIGAFIEARSCERFAKIAPYLDDELKDFYKGLEFNSFIEDKAEKKVSKNYISIKNIKQLEEIEKKLDNCKYFSLFSMRC